MLFLEKDRKNVDDKIALQRKLSRSHLFFADDLTVKYGDFSALQSVHLTIARKEILFITGSSGAGKTTLLNTLSGTIIPTSGRLISPAVDQCFIASIHQDLRLIADKSCEENLWYSYDRNIYSSKKTFASDLAELSKVLGISDRLHLKIHQANGGLKQKVALIRALLSRPDLLLADEPTAALDRESAMRVFEILEYLNLKRGLTVVWATHNKELVRQFTGRTVHLDAGKLINSGRACFI